MHNLYLMTTKLAALINRCNPADPNNKNCVSLPDVSTGSDTVKIILQILFSVIGAVAVLIITFSGFKYVTSEGNPEKAAEAKNTIIYAVIGLAIALIAFSIVTFVVGRLS